MKEDSKKTKAIVAVIAIAAAALGWTGCDSHEEGHPHAGGHTSPYPACNAITQACHEVDVGEGEVHECHDKGHAATSDADCTGVKDRCLQICAEAKAEADKIGEIGKDGGPRDDGGPHGDGGPHDGEDHDGDHHHGDAGH